MAYPGQNVSAVGVTFGPPDLSNVMDLARQAGRDSGYAEFMDRLIDYQLKAAKEQRAQAKAEAAKQKAEAAEEISDDPDDKSGSFFSKLGDTSLGALSWSLDQISRGGYAMANTFKYISDQDEDKHDDPNALETAIGGVLGGGLGDLFGKNPLHVIDDLEIGDVGGALKAAWKGATLDEKTTMSEVIKENAKDFEEDSFSRKLYGNKVYQGVVGFAGDVLVDPLTYVGAGLVTKPLKKAVEKAVDEDLVQELAQQGIKNKDTGLDLTADDFRDILGKTFAHSDTSTVPKGLTRKERKAWVKAHTIRGRSAIIKKSDQVAKTRRRLDAVSQIKAQLGESATKSLDDLIEESKTAYMKAVDEAGSKAYKSVLDKFDESAIQTGKLPVGESFNTAVSFLKLKDLMKAHGLAKWSAKTLEDLSAEGKVLDSKDLAKLEKLKKDAPELKIKRDAALKEIADHPAITEEVLDEAFDVAQKALQRSDEGRALSQRSITLGNQLKSLKPGTQQYENVKRAKEKVDDQKNDILANAFRNTIATRAGLAGALDLPDHAKNRITEISAEIEQIDEILSKGTEVYTPTGGKILSGSDQNFSELRRQKSALEKERESLFVNAMSKSVRKTVDVKTTDDFELSVDNLESLPSDVQKATRSQLNAEYSKIYEKKLDAWKRSRNRLRGLKGDYRVADLPEDLQKMFGQAPGSKSVVPKIEFDGKTILRNTQSKAAIRESLDAAVGHEYQTFDEAFEAAHGKSVDEALRELQIAEGRYIEVDGKTVTENEFLDWAKENPTKLAYGFGIQVPLAAIKEVVSDQGLIKEFSGKFMDYRTLKSKMGGKLTPAQKDKWEELVTAFVHSGKGVVNQELRKSYNRQFTIQRAKRTESAKGEMFGGIPDDVKTRISEEAKQEALSAVGTKLKSGKIEDLSRGEDLLLPSLNAADGLSPEAIHEAAVRAAKADFERAAQEARREARELAKKGTSLTPETFALRNEILRLRKERDELIKAHGEALDEAVATKKSLAERFEEEALLRAIDDSGRQGKSYVRLNMMGMKLFDVPTGDKMFRSVEKFSELPLIRGAWSAFEKAFTPASKLPSEMNLARLRMQARTPEIIKQHVLDLHKTFSPYKPSARKVALQGLKSGRGINDELSKQLKTEFDDMVKYLDGTTTMKGEPITAYDINKFLPSEFQFVEKTGKNRQLKFTDGLDVIKNMRNMPENTDPMKALWALRIATEQTMAWKALHITMKDTFGVAREVGPRGSMLSEKGKLIEKLRDEHGWQTVAEIGDSHFFPPDVADDMRTLFKIMKPGEQAELMQYFDKMLRAWKATVTVYNPGYYTRNGIGESMMCLFDGMTNPAYFGKARSVLKAKLPDETREALKEFEVWKKHETLAQKEGRVVVRLPNGRKLNVNEVWALYHDAGLKSGFVSSEFDHVFPAMGTVRATPVGQIASKVNDTVRRKGEGFEDFFRLAHFMYRMENPIGGRAAARGLKPEELAQQAADVVRKYHFDYTDFTPFEKSVGMRVFPFYKWTRKAMPLMTTMLFTRPGLISLYPKAMTNLGVATGGLDPSKNENGWLPDYEKVTPAWMQDLFAYPVGTGEGGQNYMNVATPALDIYKMLNEPVSASISMLNPMFKMPLEQAIGRQLDPDFDIELDAKNSQGESLGYRNDHLMRATPLSSLIDKIIESRQDPEGTDSPLGEPGAPMDEVLFSFLSGLGVYENNESRQKGEQFRRNMEGR